MPSGRTHDSITLWTLPIVTSTAFGLTQSGYLALFVSGGYLFSGLMFGPDLDIHSQQYKRWGILRWIWLPYRKSMRHRSLFSHGFIVGTIGRLLYLTLWAMIFAGAGILVVSIAQHYLGMVPDWQESAQQSFSVGTEWMARSLYYHSAEWLALTIGFELGAMSHSLSDWTGSVLKRMKRRRKR
jgi:uncharacterized metal-binding protein